MINPKDNTEERLRQLSRARHFLQAAHQGDIRTLEDFLRAGIDIDTRGARGETALFCAVFCNKPDAVRLLLDAGANPNLHEADGTTPLMWAADDDKLDLLQALLSAGARAAASDYEGKTAIDRARTAGAVQSLRLLEERATLQSAFQPYHLHRDVALPQPIRLRRAPRL